MARGLVSLKSSGLKEFIKEMEFIADHIPEIAIEALAAQQAVVEQKIKANWSSMVGGSPTGYVASSVGQSVAYSKVNKTSVVGTVGVYKIDKVGAAFGKTDKDLNAAQIAYWVEFGTSRLMGGIRKKKGVEYDDSQLITVAAKPFISNAFYSSLGEQQEAFKFKFNQLVDQYRYTG